MAGGDARRTAVVTGSSSGIGLAASLALARAGYAVYATVRDASRAGRLEEAASAEGLDVRIVQMDVDDGPSVEAAVLRVRSEAGRIDVLVNNAGYGAVGAVEDVPMAEFKAQFETNLFGALRVMKAAAPAMRETAAEGGRGPGPTIVNVSSVAGRIGFPATSAYISSKFALEGLGENSRRQKTCKNYIQSSSVHSGNYQPLQTQLYLPQQWGMSYTRDRSDKQKRSF